MRNAIFLARIIWTTAIMQCFLSVGCPNVQAQNSMEICDNGMDDDMDGLIDLNDSDCPCEVVLFQSLIPNPSFEEINCCPSDRSQLNCANVWIQASEPTTDLLHTCGWLGWPEFSLPLPFPDGNAIVGFRDGRYRQGRAEPTWKEYAGACLLGPLKAGIEYRFQFDIGFSNDISSPPIDVTVFGTTDCRFLPFGVNNEKLGCPTDGPNWIELGSVNVSGMGQNKWVRTNVNITPAVDIKAIAIGPPCKNTSATQNTYYYFDNLILTNFENFDLRIGDVNMPCSPNYALQVPSNSNFTYQWYFNGAALLDETSHSISKMYGDGNYSVRVVDEIGRCRLSESFEFQKPKIVKRENITICEGTLFSFGETDIANAGIYNQVFTSIKGCDSIVTLEVAVIDPNKVDTISATVFKGEVFEASPYRITEAGSYLLKFERSIGGCDSLILLQLSQVDLLFPNIFSPNGDGQNDSFGAIGSLALIDRITYAIYDRWGNLIYGGNEPWTGNCQDAECINGVYIYTARIVTNSGFIKDLVGDITLLR